MGLTATIGSKLDYPRSDRVVGNLKLLAGTLAFDSSYAADGEAIPAAITDELTTVWDVWSSGRAGYDLDFDITNSKVKLFAPAPALVIQEKHVGVANLITLDYPAAWIINVCEAGQNLQWVKRMAAATLGTNQFCLVSPIADGVRTQIYTDGATDTVYVTYITQAWAELYDLLVQEEALTLATGANALAYAPMAFGHLHALATGALEPIDASDSVADGEVDFSFIIAAGVGTAAVTINAAQNTETAVCTYLKKPAATTWIGQRLVADEDPTKAGADPYTQTFDFPCLAWLISGFATVNGGTTLVLIDQETTCATGEISTNWAPTAALGTGAAPAAGFQLGAKDNVTVTAGCYIKGFPWEIPGLVPLEVRNGTDLSGLSVRFTALGKE